MIETHRKMKLREHCPGFKIMTDYQLENTPSMVATDDYFNHGFVILKFL